MMMDHFTKAIKKIIKLFCIVLTTSLVFLSTSCNKDEPSEDVVLELATPTNLKINEDEILNWDEVLNATGYKVLLENENGNSELDTDTNSIDLFPYLNNSSEFKISVYAYDKEKEYLDSDKSSAISYKISCSDVLFKGRKINDGKGYEIAVADKNKISGKVVVPSSLNGIPVVKIAKSGFNQCKNVTSIVVPSSVTELGEYVFDECENLVRISLSNFIKEIPKCTFWGCTKLVDVNIPTSTVTIGPCAFYYCASLEKIYIPVGVSTIDPEAFGYCDNLKNIVVDLDNDVYKEDGQCVIRKEDNALVVGTNYSVIPNYVTEIVSYGFSSCTKLEKIIVPGSVKRLGSHSFIGCEGLKEIIFEEGVEEILTIPTMWYSIEKVRLPHSAKNISNLFEAKACNNADIFPNGNERYIIDGNCIIDNENLSVVRGFDHNVEIPSYAKTIGYKAFIHYEDEYIKLPDGLEEIKDRAFYCTKLKEIEFPSSLKYIGSNAFAGSELQNVIFSEGLEVIEEGSFKCCFNIEHIELPKSLKVIWNSAFAYCFCPIMMYTPVETIGGSPFYKDTVYTCMELEEIGKYIEKNTLWNHGCTTTYMSEFEDGYIKSFEYYKYSKMVGINLEIYWESVAVGLPSTSFLPYRKGYKFLGWATNPNTNEIVIKPFLYEEELEITLNFDKIINYSLSTYFWCAEDFAKFESGTTFYSVWEKTNSKNK